MQRHISHTVFAFFLLFALSSVCCYAQVSKSYRFNYSYCPQTGGTLGYGAGMVASYLTFYDGYLTDLYDHKYILTSRGNDGSYVYQVEKVTNPLFPTQIIVSSNGLQYTAVLNSSFAGFTTTQYNYYTYLGDGKQPALDYSSRGFNVHYGGSSGSSGSGGSDSRPSKRETCSSCGGTGVNPNQSSGGNRSSWVAHYNSSGSKCPYCGRYNEHYHTRCASCNVPRY